MTRLLGAVALGLTLFASHSSAWADVFGAKEKTLANGLQVVVVENHRAPVVTQVIFFKAGAMDEEAGKSGIAHVLEHLSFKGTDTLGPGEFSATIARNGGQDNAFTNQDMTAYYQSVSSDRLDLIMRLEADRLAHLRIATDTFKPELQVVLEERNMRTDNNPSAILREQAARSFYRNHPYGNPVIGWKPEVSSLTLADAEQFHAAFYAPNNAILVIAGDVKAEDVFKLAEKYYGPIPAKAIPARPDWKEPKLLVSTTVTYRDARVTQPSLSLRKQAPSWNTAKDPKTYYALVVLDEILNGGSTGRIYKSLVIDQGVAAGAGGWYRGDRRGPGVFAFYVTPSDGGDLSVAEAALREQIALLKQNGVTEDEVNRAITKLQDSAATARDSLEGPPMAIGQAMAVGIPLAEIEAWPDRIGAVTVADVNAAAAMVLNSPGEVVSQLLPAQDPEVTQ